MIKTYSDKHGFVDYRDAKRLGSITCEMAGEAMIDLEKGLIQKSMFIALAIIEEMADLVSYNADDSDGQIGGSIEDAFAVLEALTELNLNEMQHDGLYMIKLGACPMATDLIHELKVLYPTRRALLEELGKV